MHDDFFSRKRTISRETEESLFRPARLNVYCLKTQIERESSKEYSVSFLWKKKSF